MSGVVATHSVRFVSLTNLKNLLLGAFLSVWAIPSLIALGWLARMMRARAFETAGLGAAHPGWILGESGAGRVSALVGGLAANIREGVMMAISLGIAALPFGMIWLLGWWAGWENSFSKGYEQAFVGPLLGLGGVAVFCLIMIWHPMALAHQAVENRALALFEWRRVRSAVRHAGIGYLFLAVTTVIFALPIFASRGLIVFASNIVPGFDQMSAEAALALGGQIDLVRAIYAFGALLILRRWLARLYALAVARALDGPDAHLWKDSPLAMGRIGGRRPWSLTHWVRATLLAVVWFGLAAQIFVGQFLNHDWHIWITHPFWLLPWSG